MTATQYFITFATSAILGLVFTPMAIGMAVRWRIAEKPNGRTGRGEIAHIGGVAIIGSIMFSMILVFLFFLPQHPLNRAFLPVIIASGFLIFLLGIIDDLRSLHYLYKLFFQITVSIFVAAGGLGLLQHFGLVELSIPAAVITSMVIAFWMLTITTSFNLIDGIDGLAAGVAAISAGAFATAGILIGMPLVAALSMAVFGAALAFLRYNFPPARIFMGDSGSLFFGLMFGLIALLVLIPGDKVLMRSLGSVIILSLPLLDTGLAFLRRVMSGRPPFEADHMHIHHILLFGCGSTRKVDTILWTLSAVFGALGILTILGYTAALAAAAVLEAAVSILALRRMVRFDMSRDKAEQILSECGVSSSSMAVHND
jgi:UDP-GlcNAc:undecaprenyl-phosphate GlcNAc-1-phosphate transferase